MVAETFGTKILFWLVLQLKNSIVSHTNSNLCT